MIKGFFFFEKEHHNMRKFIITMGCFTMTFSKFNMIKNYEKWSVCVYIYIYFIITEFLINYYLKTLTMNVICF